MDTGTPAVGHHTAAGLNVRREKSQALVQVGSLILISQFRRGKPPALVLFATTQYSYSGQIARVAWQFSMFVFVLSIENLMNLSGKCNAAAARSLTTFGPLNSR